MAKKPGRNNNFLWGLIAVFSVGLAGAALALFMNLIQTETYYILNEDVPSRAAIYPEMLSPVTVSKGGAPEAALGIQEVQDGAVFSNYPLLAGDILTASNVGAREDISVGIPDEWVVTNFSVQADDAVGGRIQRGYYFDMLVVDESGGFYPFVNVLALDTTVDMSSASSADAADTEEATAGMTTQYVVGMTPENAAKLHQIVNQYSNIKLVLSPRQNEYNEPRMEDYEGIFSYTPGDSPINLGEGTDYTFTVLPRDDFGRISQYLVSCGTGNAVISKDNCSEEEQNYRYVPADPSHEREETNSSDSSSSDETTGEESTTTNEAETE